jgi:hypothetical protein
VPSAKKHTSAFVFFSIVVATRVVVDKRTGRKRKGLLNQGRLTTPNIFRRASFQTLFIEEIVHHLM